MLENKKKFLPQEYTCGINQYCFCLLSEIGINSSISLKYSGWAVKFP